MKRKPYILMAAVLLPAVLCCALLPARASSPAETAALEETIFLGEAVPLQTGGGRLEDLLLQRLPQEEGRAECWWISPQGPAPLDKLGKQRPSGDTEYQLSAVLHRGSGKDAWVNLTYRVRVVSGRIRVWAGGEEIDGETHALVKLEGPGITLYRKAALEADPQGGQPVLETEFAGLPFGVYTLTVMTGGLSPETAVCRLGVCQEDDTVSPDRRTALVRFTAQGRRGGALEESYRLRTSP